MNKTIRKKFKPLPPLLLIRSIQAMHPGQMIDKSVLYTLQNGFESFLVHGQSLDEAFCIKQTRIRANYGIDQRNRHLRLAEKYCIFADCIGKKAKIMAAEIKIFEAIIWPKWKGLEEPPIKSSLLRKSLFFAKKAWDKLPNERQLVRIIKNDK